MFKSKFKILNSKDGFTMIELLVVISIVIILPTIIIANFPQIKLQFALSRVTYKFAQDVRSAQNLALSSIPYKDLSGAVLPINGYGVYVDANAPENKKYKIYADCAHIPNSSDSCPPNGNQQYGLDDYTISTIDFSVSEPGVVIKRVYNVFSDSASINFSPPIPTTNITSLNQGANSVDVVFALSSDLTKTRTVSVNSSGLIEIK